MSMPERSGSGRQVTERQHFQWQLIAGAKLGDHRQHDIAGILDSRDQRCIGLHFASRRFGEQHVVDNDLRPCCRQLLDQSGMQIPRPGPAAVLLEALLVDLDDDDAIVRRCCEQRC